MHVLDAGLYHGGRVVIISVAAGFGNVIFVYSSRRVMSLFTFLERKGGERLELGGKGVVWGSSSWDIHTLICYVVFTVMVQLHCCGV